MPKTFEEHMTEHTCHAKHPDLDAIIAAAHAFQKAIASNLPGNPCRERNIALFESRILDIMRDYASEFRS